MTLQVPSTALSRLCDPRAGAHLRLLDPSRQWAAETAQLYGCKPHLDYTLTLSFWCLGQYQIIQLGNGVTCVNNLVVEPRDPAIDKTDTLVVSRTHPWHDQR